MKIEKIIELYGDKVALEETLKEEDSNKSNNKGKNNPINYKLIDIKKGLPKAFLDAEEDLYND